MTKQGECLYNYGLISNDEILKNILLKMELFKDIFLLNRVRQIIHAKSLFLKTYINKIGLFIDIKWWVLT
jgi:hypothetical protein